MTKVFPLHGYATIRKYDTNEVTTVLNKHFDFRHLMSICKFCDLMLEGLDQVQIETSKMALTPPVRRTQSMTMSLSDLRESGCYVETNLFYRPLLGSLIKKCTNGTNGDQRYVQGSIVITRFEDIFLKSRFHYARTIIQQLYDLKIPIFAIEESRFSKIIREIETYPGRDELYEEIIWLSYGYYKSLERYL